MKALFILLLCSGSLFSFGPWGNDSDLCEKKEHCPQEKLGPLQKVGEILIHFHQEVISPIDGPRSHFRPSSSQYALDAIKRYGFFSGIPIGCDRLMRENEEPWVYPTVPFDRERLKWDPVDDHACVKSLSIRGP